MSKSHGINEFEPNGRGENTNNTRNCYFLFIAVSNNDLLLITPLVPHKVCQA